ncbi:unnamed protein product [Danaus chrysippus]|uniref:(African queen) hypothetical protein n=1 Tax=Danaus chrysippus TaxID=151541 RepID=A0A8J2QR26_9NEOP|nr:unnamed protein product [Danaus chrysippus]
MCQSFKVVLTIIVLSSVSRAKIIRNNALMTKMVSNYQRDNDVSEPEGEKTPVLTRMQQVLCKNFPTIPCEMITEDKTLKKLIEKSIQQINFKKLSLDKTTPLPRYLTLFPVLNNEDLSNYVQTHDVYKDTHKKNKIIKDKKSIGKRKNKTKSKHTAVYNRKKMRKFYPHKVKYRDKNTAPGTGTGMGTGTGTIKEDFGDNSADKLSMSVEVPDMTLTRKHQHYSYKMEPADSPVWRIDYMKHGEHSLDLFRDQLGDKLVESRASLARDHERPRKDVLHSDVIIKKNYVRKNTDGSDGAE